jgi:hypothetical protein
MTKPAGYSGTPLPQKLGIKAGFTICVRGTPRDYAGIVAPLPDGVRMAAKVTDRTDLVHIFATSRTKLAAEVGAARRALRDDAMIWVSWPKKSSGVTTDITEDTVRAVAFPLGLVDIKVCAVDETWSGLKLMVRKENRKAVPKR